MSLWTCVRVSQEKIPTLVAGSRVWTYLTFWSAFPSVWIRNTFSSYLPQRSCDRILVMNDLLLTSDLPLFQMLVRLSILKKIFGHILFCFYELPDVHFDWVVLFSLWEFSFMLDITVGRLYVLKNVTFSLWLVFSLLLRCPLLYRNYLHFNVKLFSFMIFGFDGYFRISLPTPRFKIFLFFS